MNLPSLNRTKTAAAVRHVFFRSLEGMWYERVTLSQALVPSAGVGAAGIPGDREDTAVSSSVPLPQDAREQEAATLLAAARAGSADALGTLFASIRGYLRLAAARDLPRSIREAVSASDLVQDTLVAAHRGFEGFRGGSRAEFLAWARAILSNTAIDRLRYEKAARRDGPGPHVPLDAVGSGDDALVDVTHERPDSRAIRREDSRLVEEGMAALPADQRRVLWMRHWEGRPFVEIAADLGRSEVAVRKMWGRGLERLSREIRSRTTHPGSTTDGQRDG